MATLDLRLLGGFEARGADGRPVTIPPRKARALLAHLAVCRGKALPRESLSTLVWGDISSGEQARRSLRQALTTLRRALPDDVLIAERETIALRLTASVDVAEFEQYAKENERSALERALVLYRGELLEGFSACADGFDAWLERERRRLRTLAADAMQRLCEAQHRDGDAEAAMATAMRLVATDPVREAAHRQLMDLYAEAGRGSEAVRQFHTLRALLSERLGTAPDARTAELFERIQRSSERRQAPSAAPARGSLTGPELRQVCVLALALAEASFDAALEQDLEVTVAGFGGTLFRVVDDLALTVFGFPRAHDNDLERAIRAGLSLSSRLEAVSVKASIGVADGQVLSDPTFDRPALHGDVLGRATQLARLSAVGVVASGSVVRALGERLSTAPLTEGHGGDGRRVLRWLEASEIALATPLVGRDFELAQLESALDLCIRTRRGRTFILRGEAGIGKTRLLTALCSAAAARGFAVHTRTLVDFGGGTEDPPVVGLVRELLSDTPPESRRAGGGSLDDADVALLLSMVRAIAPRAPESESGARVLTLRRRRAAICKLLADRSALVPRLLCIDDIQWADAETLAQIGAWVDVAASCPVILLLTTRIEGEPDAAAFRGRAVSTLDLAPLSPEETRALAGALAEEHGAGPDGSELLISRSGGNPLFLEQLVRSRHTGFVPPTIQSLVQARCDTLDVASRATLQAASVLGQWFTVPALSHLLDLEPVDLGTLAAQSWITEQPDGYRFAHALVRDAIYETLTRERRSELHASAARYYAGRDATLHAQHLERAGDPAAANAYLQAAMQKRRTGDLERALSLALRARELAEGSSARHEATLLAGELLIEMGRPEEALTYFAEVDGATRKATDRARAAIGSAAALRILDRSKEALLALANAESLIDPMRDGALLSRVHYLRGNVLFPLGDAAACLRSQTLALEAARRAGSSLGEAQALSGIADAHYVAGRFRTARAVFARCEDAARRVGSLELELTSRGMLHILDGYDLAFDSVVAGCQEVAQRSSAAGSLRTEALMRSAIALSHLYLGNWEAALPEATRAAALADQIGSRRFAALGLGYAAIAHIELGDRGAARSAMERALSLAHESGFGFAGGVVYAARFAAASLREIPSLLDEAEVVLQPGSLVHSILMFAHRAIPAALAAGDEGRALRYAAAVESSMREEPHALGTVLAGLGRTLVTARRARTAEQRQAVDDLKRQLEEAGMRPTLAIVDRFAAVRA